MRNTMLDPRYAHIFPFASLRGDSKSANHFAMTAGGNYWGLGYGGPLSGRGAHLFLIDDPIKNSAEANSPTHRKKLQDWYTGTAYTRLEPGAAVVIISTRWHEDDLAGWLLREHANENWTVINLPAVAEPNDPLGRREGQALWPERFPRKRLDEIREQVGSRVWNAEYQQRPEAAEGGTFKRLWWQFYNKATLPPRFDDVIISLDTAFKEGAENDYSAAVVMGVTQSRLYVLDVWRGRVDFPKLIRQVESACDQASTDLSATHRRRREWPGPDSGVA